MDPHLLAALREGLTFYIILAASIALHEFGHAKAADMVGDPLPRLQGRVTLNPLAHLDPIGTGLIPLAMIFLPILMGSPLPFGLIGWGRPVQISLPNPRTRVRDEILITLAGPGMNVVIALVAAIVSGIAHHVPGHFSSIVIMLADFTIYLNCILIAFNLIPLPPLDGSRLMRHLVGMGEETFYRLAANSWWILLLLINTKTFQILLGRVALFISRPFSFIIDLLAG